MNDLAVIERENKQWVNARDLHERLGVGKRFADWIKNRIEECGFEEGREYFPNLGKTSPNENGFSPNLGKTSPLDGRPKIEYLLTVQAAMILAAMENSTHRQEILKLLSKTTEAWNTPEMVAARAEQMGVAVSKAQFDQLSAQVGQLSAMLEKVITENQAFLVKIGLLPERFERVENAIAEKQHFPSPKDELCREIKDFVSNYLKILPEYEKKYVFASELYEKFKQNNNRSLGMRDFVYFLASENPGIETERCGKSDYKIYGCKLKNR
jgi:anti-repressor protein